MKTKRIITIVDDNKEFLKLSKDFLLQTIPDIDVHTETNPNELLESEYSKSTSLFIIDIELGKDIMNGMELCQKLYEKNKTATYLFISGYDYDYEKIVGIDATYDFISKPAPNNLMSNRCKILLRISETFEYLEDSRHQIRMSMWELFNHTNLYLIVLDAEMNVSLCSNKLAMDMGYEGEMDLIGTNWLNYIPDNDKPAIITIHKTIIGSDPKECHRFQEVTSDVCRIDDRRITVRWFNACIENGTTWTFSIGIPLTPIEKGDNNIDSIREYWQNIIQKDKTTIDAFKEIIKKDHTT